VAAAAWRARGQPVVEGLARGLRFAAGLAALQLGLLQRGLRVLFGLARFLDLGTQLLGRWLVQEVIHAQRGFDPGQIAHDGATQANEEAGKHQRHQPQATAEPFFGQPKRFAHDHSPL
jgi:hypothetical protein